jgi:hypothetical protein
MRCTSCGTENAEGLKFCNQCGTVLKARCAKCGFDNSPGSRFCGQCGVALAPSGAASTKAPTSVSAASVSEFDLTAEPGVGGIPDGERKTVTALFADIKGSMELMEGLDPEEARAIVDPALKLMIDAVHRYDGYIVQSTGDGIFALFGAPVAHEDHAQRALYAGLRMQEDIRRYAETLRAEGQPPLQVRAGANTGEAVVRSIHTGGGRGSTLRLGIRQVLRRACRRWRRSDRSPFPAACATWPRDTSNSNHSVRHGSKV